MAAPIALPSPLVAAVASASTSCVVVVEGPGWADGQLGGERINRSKKWQVDEITGFPHLLPGLALFQGSDHE
jgi:hypothetical protein